jgi:hypothetical protein
MGDMATGAGDGLITRKLRFPVIVPLKGSMFNENCPQWIDWAKIAPFEKQALENHSQTLLRLSQRGGLSPREIYAVMKWRGWKDFPNQSEISDDDCVEWIRENCL